MLRILPILAAAALGLYASSASAWTHKRTPTGAVVRWSRAVVNVHLSAEVRDLTDQADRDTLDAAAEWQAMADVPMLVVEERVASEQAVDGLTGIYLPDEWTYDPGRLAVTVSSYVTETGELVDADILLNRAFFPSGGGRYDLGRLLAHEFGHVLGLGESEVPAAAMFATIPPGGRLRHLHADDIEGVTTLYAGIPLERVAGTPSACSAAGGAGGVPQALAMLLWLSVLRRRR